MNIFSRSHALVKELKAIRDDSRSEQVFLEGPKLLMEALQTDLPLEILVVSSTLKDHQAVLELAKPRAKAGKARGKAGQSRATASRPTTVDDPGRRRRISVF